MSGRLEFTEAVREQVPLRMALVGANGSGKTLAALRVADALGGTVAVVDTERGRAKLYADRFTFLHAELHDHTPEGFRDAVRQAAEIADTVVIDSFSHEWMQILTEVDKFGDWKSLTPRHRECLEAMLAIPRNLIVTMRAKVKYGVEEVDVPGRDKPKQVITRLGVGPVQRDGVEYEFDILAYLDTDHVATFSNRCDPLVGKSLEINDETLEIIKTWLAEGDPPPPPPPFNPAQDLAEGAKQFQGKDAFRLMAEALGASAPDVDWGATLNGLATQLYDVPEVKKIPRGALFTEFQIRLANATARLGELATPDAFPPADAQTIQEAFAEMFDGAVLVTVPKELSAAPEDAGEVPDVKADEIPA